MRKLVWINVGISPTPRTIKKVHVNMSLEKPCFWVKPSFSCEVSDTTKYEILSLCQNTFVTSPQHSKATSDSRGKGGSWCQGHMAQSDNFRAEL